MSYLDSQSVPSAYQMNIGFRNKGTYFVTGFKSSIGRTFGTSFRKTQFQTGKAL